MMVNKDVSESVYTDSDSNFKVLSVGVKDSSGEFICDLPLGRAYSKKYEKVVLETTAGLYNFDKNQSHFC